MEGAGSSGSGLARPDAPRLNLGAVKSEGGDDAAAAPQAEGGSHRQPPEKDHRYQDQPMAEVADFAYSGQRQPEEGTVTLMAPSTAFPEIHPQLSARSTPTTYQRW